ncbi:MAG: hypothetical protein EOO01_33100, partial [Chitinophagaceae bacterium]
MRIFWFFFLVLLSIGKAGAVEEPYVNEVKGVEIAAGKFFTVADEKFGNTAAWSSIHHTMAVHNVVSFELNFDNTLSFYNKPFACTINFKIYIYGNPSDTTQITDSTLHSNVSLSIRYDTVSGKAYKGIALYKFKDAHKFGVKIISISSPELNPIPAIFRLKGQVIVEREYTFQNVSSDITRFSFANGNLLKLEWTPSGYPGAETFDLEYTHIDDSSRIAAVLRNNFQTAPNQYSVPADTLEKWFKNNATRINTSAASYLLDVPFPSGFLLFRIRGALVHYADGIRWEGAWNYAARWATQPCSAACPSGIVAISAHEPALNWQYSAVFAEEGKSKKIMSYADALLYSRQTITLN